MTARLRHNATDLFVFLTVLVSVCSAECPAGQYKPYRTTWCCNSKCPPGTRITQDCPRDNPDEVTCQPCDPEYYNPYPNQDTCRSKTRCDKPHQEVQTNGTTTSDNVCRCLQGYYRRGDVCRTGPVCQPGTGATRNGTCQTCPEGMFSNETSHTQPCMAWTRCWLFGFMTVKEGTNVSDAVCMSIALEQLYPTASALTGENTTLSPTDGEALAEPHVPLWIILLAVFGSFGSMILLVAGPAVIIIYMYRKRHPPQQNQNGAGPQSGERQTFLYRSADGSVRIRRTSDARPGEVEIEMETFKSQDRLNMENGNHLQPGEDNNEQRSPDDGISTGADDSSSETLSHLSQETGDVQTSSDWDGTDQRRKLRKASPREASEVPVNEMTTEYIVSNLGNRYLRLARCLPAMTGNIFSVTDIADLRHTYTLHGPSEAIRETIETWKRKNGEQATLEGLLIGLYTCEMNGIVEHLCQLNNVRHPDWYS